MMMKWQTPVYRVNIASVRGDSAGFNRNLSALVLEQFLKFEKAGKKKVRWSCVTVGRVSHLNLPPTPCPPFEGIIVSCRRPPICRWLMGACNSDANGNVSPQTTGLQHRLEAQRCQPALLRMVRETSTSIFILF